MDNIIDVIAGVKRFSTKVFEPNKPASQYLIDQFESEYQLILPADYKYFMLQMDGFRLLWNSICGLTPSEGQEHLGQIYEREHFQVAVPQFLHLVPFHNDGGGNFYCFDTSTISIDGTSCPVVFWVSNYAYSETDLPEVVNDSFAHWMKEVIIGWSLEEFDYDGNRRS